MSPIDGRDVRRSLHKRARVATGARNPHTPLSRSSDGCRRRSRDLNWRRDARVYHRDVTPPPWMLREIERRARSVLSRLPIGDVDLHELASLALDLVTNLKFEAPYRDAPTHEAPDAEDELTAMATLERQLSECRAELLSVRREIQTLRKG